MSRPHQRLMVFARTPERGRVKTRLAAELGDDATLSFHEACIREVTARHRQTSRSLVVYAAGDVEHPFWSTLSPAPETLEAQRGSTLGERLQAAFEHELKTYRHVVVLGTDSPHLPTSLVDRAFEALTEAPVVLGPAEDGGYYLLGLAGTCPPIFGIDTWGTDRVLSDTISALDRHSIRYHLMPTTFDVDWARDLVRLRLELQTQPEGPVERWFASQENLR